MAKTLANCRSQTRTYLDEVSAADWTDSQVDMAINAAYQQTITAVIQTFEDYYLTKTQLNTVADQQEYGNSDGIPTNLFKIRRVEINYNPDASGSKAQRALPVNFDEVRTNLDNNLVGLSVNRNPGYYKYGFGSNLKIGFIPAPTKNGTNAISIWYIPTLSDLSSPTDSLNIPYPDMFWWAIPLIAAGSLLRKGQQEEVPAQQYIQEGGAKLDEMRELLEDLSAEEAKTVIDVE